MPFEDAVKRFDVVAFLEQYSTDVKEVGDEVECLCVNCENHEMSTNMNTKLGQCWSCGFKFNLVQLVMTTLDIPFASAREMIVKQGLMTLDRDLSELDGENEEPKEEVPFEELKPEELPEDYEPIYGNDDYTSGAIKCYLISRGIGPRLWRRYDMGYSLARKYWNCVIIPITYKGRQVYFTSRSVKGPKKFRNPYERGGHHRKSTVLLGHDHLDLGLGFVCIGEGPFDALSLPNGLSPLGKTLSEVQVGMILELPVSLVYICLDGGAEEDANEMASSLVDYKEVRMVRFPEDTDPNDNKGCIQNYLNASVSFSARLDLL